MTVFVKCPISSLRAIPQNLRLTPCRHACTLKHSAFFEIVQALILGFLQSRLIGLLTMSSVILMIHIEINANQMVSQVIAMLSYAPNMPVFNIAFISEVCGLSSVFNGKNPSSEIKKRELSIPRSGSKTESQVPAFFLVDLKNCNALSHLNKTYPIDQFPGTVPGGRLQ